jgi:hypothetical protein
MRSQAIVLHVVGMEADIEEAVTVVVDAEAAEGLVVGTIARAMEPA